MENQKTGYIPLYRSILKQSWAKDVYLRTLWENLLLNAARKPYKANFKGHEWHLQPGQLVVTAADLGLQLSTIAHECAHMAFDICSRVGVDVEPGRANETYCYLMSRLVEFCERHIKKPE